MKLYAYSFGFVLVAFVLVFQELDHVDKVLTKWCVCVKVLESEGVENPGETCFKIHAVRSDHKAILNKTSICTLVNTTSLIKELEASDRFHRFCRLRINETFNKYEEIIKKIAGLELELKSIKDGYPMNITCYKYKDDIPLTFD